MTPESHPFIDIQGRRYTAAVLAWHPAARHVLGIRALTADELARFSSRTGGAR